MLLEAVGAAVLDEADAIVSPSADRFVDQLVATGVDLVLVDAAAAPQELADFLSSLRQQFPQLLVLVAGPGNVQHLIAFLITDGTVFRFVHKPASAQRLKLFIDAALRERQARTTQQILSASLPGGVAAARPDDQQTRPWWMTISLAIVLTVVAAGVFIWYTTRSDHSAVTANAPSQSAAPEAAPATPSDIAGAHAAVPVNDAAALAAAEKDAIDRAAAERSERSEKERIAAEMDARQAALADQIRRAAKDDAQQALTSDNDNTQHEDGEVTQPAQFSAPAPAPVAPAAAPPVIAAAASAQPVSVEPVAATVPEAQPTPTIVPESVLHRVNFVAPVYPPEALLRQQTGVVELDFTVTPEGTVTDIKVTGADPQGVFEHASVTALSHDRYEPVMRDGAPVAQRAHIRLRFTL
jgi:TonB family protein